MERGKYSFDQYTSMDVYRAVLKDGVTTPEQFLANYKKHPRT